MHGMLRCVYEQLKFGLNELEGLLHELTWLQTMKWTIGGPELPPELLQLLEDGNLVLFCGAGVSIPAGLPSFKGLVEKVYEFNSQTIDGLEKSEFCNGNYDRVLGMLERRIEASLVRKAVIQALKLDSSADLNTHRALLKLATSRDGVCRLVTTNFDQGFAYVNKGKMLIDSAPRLPVPKIGTWSSIVHLHGRISDEDPEGKSLVMTSADFGSAYLTERWASRFLSDLFRRFSVLFVGYSVADPVVRYMMDAFASDRAIGEGVGKAFVLASCGGGDETKEKFQWEAKGVVPLLYDSANGHAALHSTIERWADCHSRGQLGKASVINQHAGVAPAKPFDENLGVSQVLWALRDESGDIAKVFARADPLPPIDWLEVLEEQRLLSLPRDPKGKVQGQELRVPLVRQGTDESSTPPLNPVTWALGEWLSRHIDKPDAMDWIIRTGAVLHPEFQKCIRRSLAAKPAMREALRIIWSVVSSENSPVWRESHWFSYDLLDSLKKEPWGLTLRHDVLRSLDPALIVKPSMLRKMVSDETQVKDSIEFFAEMEVVLRCRDNARLLVEAIGNLPSREQILADLADDVTSLLSRAMQLQELVQQAAQSWDWSYIHVPSISPHSQNSDFQEWTLLVGLCRDTWLALTKVDCQRARSLVERWRAIRYPIFRRLCYFAMTESNLYSPKECAAYALEDNGTWLWSSYLSRERYRLIIGVWSNLPRGAITELTSRIVGGPPLSIFRAELQEEKYLELANREIWLYLSILQREGLSLPKAGRKKLQELSSAYPMWTLQQGERDEFESWMESGFGEPAIEHEDEFAALADDAVIARLSNTELSDNDLRKWRRLLQVDFNRGIALLTQLPREDAGVAAAWRSVIEEFARQKSSFTFWPNLAVLLLNVPDPILEAIVGPLSRCLTDVGKGLNLNSGLGPEEVFWAIWDRVQPFAFKSDDNAVSDYVMAAINRPAGHMTEALLNHCMALSPKNYFDIPENHWRRFRLIGEEASMPYTLARVLLAAYLSWLHRLDSAWVESKIIPFFDFASSNEAIAVWQGFLWRPRITPELWPKIKPHFLASLEHFQARKKVEEQSSRLLGMICIDKPNWLSPEETSVALASIGAKGRATVSDVLWRRLEAAEAQSNALWRDQVGPWLQQVWPKDISMRDPDSSLNLALSATYAGEEFAKAVDIVEPLIVTAKDCSQLWIRLASSELPDRHPRPTLRLAEAMFDKETSWVNDQLRKVLQRIGKADADVPDQPAYRKLDERLCRFGI